MTLQALQMAITALNRNKGAFYALTTETTPKLTKKSRSTGKPTDFTVKIRSRFSCKLGCSYEKIVNRHLEKRGEEPTFVAQKPNGKHYIEGSDFFLTDDATETKHYLAVDMISNTERVYLIDGREATPEEVEELKSDYLSKPSAPKEGVSWRTYNVDGILVVN